MNGDTGRLIDQLVAELEQGREPDLATLAADFPGQAEHLVGYLEAARRVLVQLPGSRLGDVLAPGERLGDFEVLDLLATGGMGTVYLARQLSLGRPVALKVLESELSDVQRRRFENEAKLLAPIHHPHLAEIYGYGESPQGSFIAMELVEGTSLAVLLQGTAARPQGLVALEVRRVVGWALEVARALQSIHAKRLVHRDVKPANIVIATEETHRAGVLPAGRAVLVDFGLVHALDEASLTRTRDAAMTWEYAAPEQIEGLSATPAIDTFALGVSLHDLLAGCRPGDRPRAAGGLPSLPVGGALDRDLVAIVDKATRPEQRWRYRDGGELAGDLSAWLEGRPVAARRPPLAERAVRGVRRHPGRVLAGACLLLGVWLLAATLAWMLGALRNRDRLVEAHGRGDLRSLERSAQELSAVLGPLLLPSDLRPEARRLRSREPSDALVQIARLWSTGDDLRAMQLAAARLRERGASAEPLLLRFLIYPLERQGEEVTRLQREALRLLCRVYHEREIEDRLEREQTGDLRRSLQRWLDDPGLGRGDQAWIYTGLSGCGTGSEAAWLLVRAHALRQEPEAARLAMVCARRIVQREQRLGCAAPALGSEHVALLREWLGSYCHGDLDDPGSAPQEAALDLLASLRQAGAGSELERSPWAGLAPQVQGWFDRYCDLWSRREPASWDALLPDRDTLLGVAGPVPGEGTLGLQRSPVLALPALASWDFRGGLLQGAARSAVAWRCALDEHARFGSRVRFGRFGESRIELRFHLEEQPPADLVLSLEHLAASRAYLLHGGVTHVVLELDGRPLVEIYEVDHMPKQQTWTVFRRLMTPGEHSLVIRSGQDTSTTYWLYGVRLSQG